MMRDETSAASDIKHTRTRRKYLRDFERHVISTPDPFAALRAIQSALNTTRLRRGIASRESLRHGDRFTETGIGFLGE
jgi:hypothetical protein